jgi:hypothetical protein
MGPFVSGTAGPVAAMGPREDPSRPRRITRVKEERRIRSVGAVEGRRSGLWVVFMERLRDG